MVQFLQKRARILETHQYSALSWCPIYQPLSSIITAAAPTPENVVTNKSFNANVLITIALQLIVDVYGQEHIAHTMLDTDSLPNAISEWLC